MCIKMFTLNDVIAPHLEIRLFLLSFFWSKFFFYIVMLCIEMEVFIYVWKMFCVFIIKLKGPHYNK
jgi:hypothetical protein